jgi:hypothetical protein
MKGDDVSGELKALERLLEYRSQGKLVMYRSRVVLSEIVATKDLEQRERLVADYGVLDQIPHDERVVGFHNQWDKLGGASYPLVSDIQDDKLYLEIKGELETRFGRSSAQQWNRDAQHLTQAIANECHVFLTRDYKTIIKPLREYLLSRFRGFKVRLPSEFAVELEE